MAGATEQLGLSLEVVASFRDFQKWPNGPVALKQDVEVFAPVLGKTIAGAFLEPTSGSGIADQLRLRFWGAPSIRVAHDQSLPQSLCLQLLADVPSNTSLERTRDG